MNSIPRRLWQIAGGLAIAHVVLIPLSLYLEMPALFADGTAGVTKAYVEGDIVRTFTGGLIESVGFVLLIPVLVFLGRALGRGSEAASWAAQTGVLCGLGYVVVSLGVGFPAGAAAMYGAQHGLDVDVAFAINNVRIFAYFLSLLLLGGSTLGLAIAALSDRFHPRWFGAFGLATGVALLVSTPLATVNLHDWGTLIWMVWFIGVGVLMLRHREATDAGSRSHAHEGAVGQS